MIPVKPSVRFCLAGLLIDHCVILMRQMITAKDEEPREPSSHRAISHRANAKRLRSFRNLPPKKGLNSGCQTISCDICCAFNRDDRGFLAADGGNPLSLEAKTGGTLWRGIPAVSTIPRAT